jgi:hypothetical protein
LHGVRARSLHELRAEVKAKDKFAAVGLPEAEAMALLEENYAIDADSARAFITWLKSRGGGDPAPGRKVKDAAPGTAIESWHRKGDLAAATENLLSDEASAKLRANVREAGDTNTNTKATVQPPAKGKKKG